MASCRRKSLIFGKKTTLIIYYYTKKLLIAIYVLFYISNSKKYYESWENRDAMVVIPSGLEIFSRQNIRDSNNDMKLKYSF